MRPHDRSGVGDDDAVYRLRRRRDGARVGWSDAAGGSRSGRTRLVAAVAGSLALHGRLPYTPLAGVFDVDPLGGADWPRVAAAVAVVVDNRLLLGRRD